MAIQINASGRERNLICNWLGIEILIEVYFNTVFDYIYIICAHGKATNC